jgi:hypothetical protein
VHELVKKGVYTPQARALAHLLVTAGCAQSFVGVLIQRICRTVGVEVPEVMSQHTVQQAIAEGGIAAQMQLGMQIALAEGLTGSSDATTHRHTDVVAHHLNFKDDDGKHCSHLLGVFPALDHSSQTQMDNWEKHVTEVADIFSRSPLA